MISKKNGAKNNVKKKRPAEPWRGRKRGGGESKANKKI